MPGTAVDLAMRGPCNYSCYYCVARNISEKVRLHSLGRLREIYDGLGSFTVTSLECGGSEPTIHPQIRDILKICTEYGIVSIPINNSIPPEKWLPRTHLERMLVRAALHPRGERELDLFLERVLCIRDAGATVSVVFVAHPERLEKIEKYRNYFTDHQISLETAPFQGYWRGKKYPDGYTQEERSILGLDKEGAWWYHRLALDMVVRDFCGIPCLAGFRSLFIGSDDRISRCLDDPKVLERPFDKAMPCTVKHCGCGLLLEELNTWSDSVWNNWRNLADIGPPSIPDPYENSESRYQEKKRVYWSLMKRYGKLEGMPVMRRWFLEKIYSVIRPLDTRIHGKLAKRYTKIRELNLRLARRDGK